MQGELGRTPAKGDRLTDWLRRPLTEAQRDYAASDVASLLELHDRLVAQLRSLGRLGWAEEACEELRPARPERPPDLAWAKLKDARSLRARSRAVAQAVAAWRERRRRRRTRRSARCCPTWPSSASPSASRRRSRSLPRRGRRRAPPPRSHRAGDRRLRWRRGKRPSRRRYPTPSTELDRSKRPAVTLVSAWVSQVARDSRIDTALLATRADLVAVIRGDPDARLAHGWRAELLGDGIARLMDGQAALTFDGKGSLRLIDVE